MATHRFGELVIGAVPRVVGTISKHTTLPLSYSVSPRDDFLCDIVEVRLDEVGAEDTKWLENCQSIEQDGFPVILTVRPVAEGGRWDGTERDRQKLLSTGLTNLATIDVEWGSESLPDLAAQADGLRKSLIISYHNFKKTPDLGELSRIVDDIGEIGNAIPKIATMVSDLSDIHILSDLLRAAKAPLCVIGMGAQGSKTRIAFPGMGSCLTYGYLDINSAPGQLPCRVLTQHLRRTHPAYNEEPITRKELLEFV